MGRESDKSGNAFGRRRRHGRFIAILLALVGLPACVYLGASFDALVERLDPASPEHWPREEFSQDAWQAAPPYERYRFYHDLDARELLRGRSRAELFALLGRPDERLVDPFWVAYEIRHDGGGDPPRGAHLLFIELDRAGRVRQYYVTKG